MTDEIFGREGNQLYVNSADSRSVDDLEEYIDGISAKGAVEIRVVHAMISEQEAVDSDELIVGNIAIRKRIEEQGRRVRGGNQSYSKRQANNLKNKAEFIKELPLNSGYKLKWTLTSSLDTFVETQTEAGRESHRKAALKDKYKSTED